MERQMKYSRVDGEMERPRDRRNRSSGTVSAALHLSTLASLRLSISLLALAMGTGCTIPGGGPQGIAGPYTFTAARGWPQVAVYGGLHNVIPEKEPTPLIELLLHGPRDHGRTLLRNAQGLAVWNRLPAGQTGQVSSPHEWLLVCDQGQPDVVAIDLLTGQSRMVGTRSHRPRCPVDVAVDEAGRVYVADTTLYAVLVYDAGMRFVTELRPPQEDFESQSGTRGPPPDFRPCGLLVNGGVLYIGNLAARRVERWNIDRQRWLEPLRPPAGAVVAPAGLEMSADGTLFIVDAVLARIHRLAADGQWLAPIGRPGRLPGEFVRPKQIRTTPSGLIFVTDAGRQSVQVLDEVGRFLMEIHEHADGWRGFTLPMGMVVLTPDKLPMLTQRLAERGLPVPDECVIVSDSLGHPPLTVLGVFIQPREEGLHVE
jgi:hypothetical protein